MRWEFHDVYACLPGIPKNTHPRDFIFIAYLSFRASSTAAPKAGGPLTKIATKIAAKICRLLQFSGSSQTEMVEVH